MEKITVSAANKSDTTDITSLSLHLDAPYTAQMVCEMLDSPQYTVLKAACKDDNCRSSNRIVGFLIASSVLSDTDLLAIAVEHEFRRHKIGSALLSALKDLLDSKQEKQRILLEVNEHNSAAIDFYARHGFIRVAIRKNYYKDGAALIMEYCL